MGSSGLMLLSVVLGGAVRLVRTNSANSLLKRLGMRQLPSWSLPWLAIGLGAAATAAQAALSTTSLSAVLAAAVDGVFAGALAVAGHETLVRTPSRRAAQQDEDSAPTLPPPPATSME